MFRLCWRKVKSVLERNKRILYIIPTHHIDAEDALPGRFGAQLKKLDVRLYRQYRDRIQQRLDQDGIHPHDCVIYLETIWVEASEELVREFVLTKVPKSFPNDLLTTLIVPLVRQGARVLGAESHELSSMCLEEHRDESSDEFQADIAARDAFIAQRIEQSLSPGKVGLLEIGAAHNVENYIQESDIEVRHLRHLYEECDQIPEYDPIFQEFYASGR